MSDQAPIHMQDEANLRSAIGLGQDSAIPANVLEAYGTIRRQRHRIIGGPLDVATILLVLHVAETDTREDAPEAEPEIPGQPLETSEGQIQPDVPLVVGSPMLAEIDGDLCEGTYKGPGKDGMFRVMVNRKVHHVERSKVRLKE